jgi:hypothetical protein
MSIYSPLRIFLSAGILFVFFPLFGQSDIEGKLSQELAMELKEGPEGKKYKIIVILKDQVDVNKLQEQVLRTLPTRDLQIKTLLDALQLKADRTQEKLISDIEMLEYLCNEIIQFKYMDLDKFKTPKDLSPLRVFFNEVMVAINEFNFSCNANFSDPHNMFIFEYHRDKYNLLLPSGFLSFDYFNFIMRYIILIIIIINYHNFIILF